MSIFATVYCANDEDKAYFMMQTDRQVARAVRKSLESGTREYSDRLTAVYRRWVQCWHTVGMADRNGETDLVAKYTAEANALVKTMKVMLNQTQD